MLSRFVRSKTALSLAAALTGILLLGGVALATLGAEPTADDLLGTADQTAQQTNATGGLQAVLDTLVANGTITQAQEDAILAAVDAAKPVLTRLKGDILQDAASAIGISVDQLKQELPGKRLTQVAAAHGISRDTLVQRLIDAETARIDQALANGKITQTQADKLKTSLADAIGKAVDRVFAQKVPGPRRGAIVDRFLVGRVFDDAAAAIGISVDQLKQELPGKSLVQVAVAHGVSRDQLIAKLRAAIDTRLDTTLGQLVDRVTPTR